MTSKSWYHRRDYFGGAIMVAIGLTCIMAGQSYGIGTLTRMGPGFFPVALGCIIAFLGILIALTAYLSTEPDAERFLPAQPQWLAWACIVASLAAFILLGEYGGLLPATFGCVFLAALGDKDTTVTQAIGLAVFVSLLGVVIFSYLLKIPFPIIRGVWQ